MEKKSIFATSQKHFQPQNLVLGLAICYLNPDDIWWNFRISSKWRIQWCRSKVQCQKWMIKLKYLLKAHIIFKTSQTLLEHTFVRMILSQYDVMQEMKFHWNENLKNSNSKDRHNNDSMTFILNIHILDSKVNLPCIFFLHVMLFIYSFHQWFRCPSRRLFVRPLTLSLSMQNFQRSNEIWRVYENWILILKEE